MAKDYRDDSMEEAEPLTGDDGAMERQWGSEAAYLQSRSKVASPRGIWVWVAHAVLLSISLSSLGLAIYIRSLPRWDAIPATYSPAQSAVAYEIQQFDLPPVPTGPFVGKGPELHCLDLLRQANYKSHYQPLGGDTAAPQHDLEGHMDHCIDALRQFVMCQGDVNVFAFRFPFDDGDPWPDYTTPRVCRNYERIRDWAVAHTVAQGEDEPEH
ncbi:hypothetical protein BUE80_DR011895 [Diplocarpon rosae]|nr:hypothetical protein BUE80_DR011895 [Diplocarpon rosae]